MSGLSSLKGAPSPFNKSIDTASAAAKSGLSSLSNAPTLFGGSGSGSGALGGSKDAGKRADPMRASTPVMSSFGRGPANDDDEDLFPTSRGLVKKGIQRSATAKDKKGLSDSDDDDDLPLPMGRSTSAAPRSSTATSKPASSSSTNPILAMLGGDDEDDELLKGLAPPKKDTGSSFPKPSPTTAASSTSSSALSRSKSTSEPSTGPSSGVSTAGAAGRRGAPVNQSVDALMSFLKDDDILGKPLPVVEEEPAADFLGIGKSGAAPRRGRRAGEDSTSAVDLGASVNTLAAAAGTGAAPSPFSSNTMRGDPSPTSQTSSLDSPSGLRASLADMAGGPAGPSRQQAGARQLEHTPSTNSMSIATLAAGAGTGGGMATGGRGAGVAQAQPASGLSSASRTPRRSSPSPVEDGSSSDLSNSDLPGMEVTPSPSAYVPSSASGRRGGADGGAAAVRASASSRPQPSHDDSWELDADNMLPDSSNTGGGRRAGSVTPTSAMGLGSSGASAHRHPPSRLQQSSSPQDTPGLDLGLGLGMGRNKSPLRSPEESGVEESSGYTPSFGSMTRSAPNNPFPGASSTDGQRQRRVMTDTTPRTLGGVGATSMGARSNNPAETERERTAAAMAAALARREQLQGGSASSGAGAGAVSTGFRLPSERRAVDSLSVAINSPAGASPAGGYTPKTTPGVPGSRSTLSKGQPRTALQALDSSSDDDGLGPPLQQSLSPHGQAAQSFSQPTGMQRAASAKPAPAVIGMPGTRAAAGMPQPVAVSMPDPSHLHQQPAAIAPQPQHQAVHQPVPAMTAQQQYQQPQQHQASSGLPPGVTLGTSRQAGTHSAPPAAASGLPPGVTVMASQPAAAAAPAVIPVSPSSIPPGVVPLGPVGSGGVTLQPQPQHQHQHQPHLVPPGVTHITPLGQPLGVVPAVAGGGELAGQLVEASTRAATLQVDVERQRQEMDKLREENAQLRKTVADLEDALREKEHLVRDAENRVLSHDARSKLSLAETQALGLKESTVLRSELEDVKAQLARIKQSYKELEEDKIREITRVKDEAETARQANNAEMLALKQDIADMIVAAEARGRRAGLIEKEVAEAQIKAQQTALEEEKEVIHRHRLSADLLAQLTEKVRTTASSTLEREERALRALERDQVDREARLNARDKLLAEREEKLAQREREVDVLRSELTALTRSLESSTVQEREEIRREMVSEMRREMARLARESVRMDALQGSLLADREDLKVQVSMERRMLEEAREARRKERESLINEIAADRKALAAEQADVLRQTDAARAELLHLKAKLVEYEARASAALQQALAEEQRLGKAKKACEDELAAVAEARQALQEERLALETEAHSLVEFARKLQEQSAELAASNADLDRVKVDLVSARQELAREVAEVRGRALDLEDKARSAEATKKALDRERLSLATERRTLNEERVAASHAAQEARTAQLQLAEAVRQWVSQGVPIPFHVEGGGSAPMTVKAGGAAFLNMSQPAPSASPSKPTAAGGTANTRRGRSTSAGRGHGRNSLRHLLDKLGLEEGGQRGAGLAKSQADYIRKQKEFLTEMRMSAPSATVLQAFQQQPPLPTDLPLYTATAPASVIPPHHAPELSFSLGQMAAKARPSATVPGPKASVPHNMSSVIAAAGVGGWGMGGIGAVHAGLGVHGRGGVAQGQKGGGSRMFLDPHATTLSGADSPAGDRHSSLTGDFPVLTPVSASTSDHDVHSGSDTSKQHSQSTSQTGTPGAMAAAAYAMTDGLHGSGGLRDRHLGATWTIPEASSSGASVGGETPPLMMRGVMAGDGPSPVGSAAGPGGAFQFQQGAAGVVDGDLHEDTPVAQVHRGAVVGRMSDLSDTAISPLRSGGLGSPQDTDATTPTTSSSTPSAAVVTVM